MAQPVFTLHKISDMFEVDRRYLARLVRHSDPDSKAGGGPKWKLSTIVALIRADERGKSGGLDLTDERAKFTKEQTARERRKNAEAEGALVRIEDMVTLQSIENSVVRERLLSMPGELQGELGFEGSEAVDTKIREVLLELSDTDSIRRRAAYKRAGLADLHAEAIAARKDDDDAP
jgi:phage terminase Nu1 subunit (DNA packaging protein)